MLTRSQNVASNLALGVDIGRTKIAAGVVSADGDVLERVTIAAPPATDSLAVGEAVKDIACSLVAKYPELAAIGVGTAEVVEWPEGATLAIEGGGERFPLRTYIEGATGVFTVVDSDANVAAWAEARLGAAIGKRNVVLLTIGTGIGGGFILDGKIYRGASGFAGEVGHLIVQPLGELCVCGNRGCWEALASGTALGRNGRQVAAMEPDGLMAKLAGGPELVTGEIIFNAACKGDPAAVALFDKLGFWLGLGIASLILLFDPDMVVIGGGLARTGDFLLAPARSCANRNVLVRGEHLPPILLAKYQSDAGLVGAAVLALDSVSRN